MLRRSETRAPDRTPRTHCQGDDLVSDSRLPAAKRLLDLHRRMLEVQRTAFDRTFDVLSRLQEQQRELAGRALDAVPNLPHEARHLHDAWWQARINGRESYKSAVDRSFSIVDGYFERLTSEG